MRALTLLSWISTAGVVSCNSDYSILDDNDTLRTFVKSITTFDIKTSNQKQNIKVPSSVAATMEGKLQNLVESMKQRTHVEENHLKHPFERNLDESSRCDAAFYGCMPSEKCSSCFQQMAELELDWAGVSDDTSCDYVLTLLNTASLCKELEKDVVSKDLFCNTFNACVVWDNPAATTIEIDDKGWQEEEEWNDDWNDDIFHPVDCSTLKECYWEGMHTGFLGDGICNAEGCYNIKLCGWDGGDCCEGSCVSREFVECGVDGYQCKDPDAEENQSKEGDDNEAEEEISCSSKENLYKIVKYDSWGDGWDDQFLVISEQKPETKKRKEVFRTTLTSASEGESLICLEEGCYSANMDGGLWGNEISWEIHAGSGGPALARGGAPMDCTFPMGYNACENTCTDVPEPDNTAYEKVAECVSTKCLVQFQSCQASDSCLGCLETPDTPAYCFTNVNYDALVTCSICQCSEERPEYCMERGSTSGNSGSQIPAGQAGMCNAQQILGCSAAVVEFSACSNVNSIDSIISEWNNDNFGGLDTFEACAHSYANSRSHGGNSAMDCMKKLVNIIDDENPYQLSETSNDAVKELATKLYHEPEYICDCTEIANKDCPFCKSFSYFKILVRETIDACQALDEIDCPAWEEFSRICKSNMMSSFNRADFATSDQCDFIHNGCGGAGPFPAFRRLDCGNEIPKTSWDFYQTYEKNCDYDSGSTSSSSSGSSSSNTYPIPVPSPHAVVTSPTRPPHPEKPPPKPYKPGKTTPSKPYTPPYKAPEKEKDSDTSTEEEEIEYKSITAQPKKHHRVFMWLFIVCGVFGGAFFYKRRDNMNMDYVRYHRSRTAPATDDFGGETMFNSLNTGSFQPVSLPPVANPSIQMM
eukprot:CAMPEP_0194360080 /NCGR_PEP_ID=MMETSP0174-20130528/7384_1 /TAXON_ID=216777 /ORGANISM="Proboscia alata, Strain PI-D3" /LENGTH=869 /DNA_ID=CAMNT_0039131365 /DNA_START=117 /DNA_END=2726 /DNA_ORIENTATION=+